MPVYRELHEVLFLQLEQLWQMLQSHTFSKTDLQQLDKKIAQLARMLKCSQMLNEEQLTLVNQIDTFYQQHAQQSVKSLKKHSQKSLSIKHHLNRASNNMQNKQAN